MNNPTPPRTTQTDTLLFEHFATLATAPDGIARLRELILQLAVQGKLGTQDAGDEPASVLLKRIKAGKKSKTQKSTNNDEGQEEKHPHLIPKNWVWTKFDDIVIEAQPGFACGERDSQGIVQLRMNNINPRGDFIWEKILRVPFDESLKQKYELKSGDVVFNNTNSVELVGKSGFFKGFSEPIVFSNHFTRLRFDENKIDPAYVTLWLHNLWNSKIFEKICNKWIGQAAVNGNKLLNFIFPLPPPSEQHRIVAKVDRLMALCDELEARQQQERAGCLRLGIASLAGLQNAESPEEFGRQWAQVCDAFDLILDCPENVAVLRQTILQLAVQGRLVRQEPEDEPASKLVERIRKEKERLVKGGNIKRGKSSNQLNEIDTPFTIPKGWTLVSLHELGAFTGGFTPSTGNLSYWNGNIPWVSPKDVKSKYISDCELKITQSALDNNRLHMIPPESIIIVARSGILKRTLPVAITKIECTVNQDIKVIIPYLPIITEYLHLLLKGYEQFILKKLVKGGMTVQSLRYDEFEYQPFPLPPLAEQHRIVAKVDALMALCDALESRLKERAGVQGKMAGAVVKQVAGGV